MASVNGNLWAIVYYIYELLLVDFETNLYLASVPIYLVS